MNIVILDGYTTNPGDLSWNSIAELGKLTVYDRTPVDKIVERSEGADVLLTNKTPVTADTLSRLKSVSCICVMATGFNIVDVAAAQKLDIPVLNVPAYSTPSVVQHTFALLFALTNYVSLHSDDVRSGGWIRVNDWTYQLEKLSDLGNKTFGVIGFGKIGSQVAKVAEALGMKILVHHTHPEKVLQGGLKAVTLEELFSESDVVSLHCPLTKDNNQFVNRDLLNRMKKSAYLINTARGGLINEPDLAEALNSGALAGAGLDVLSSEPPDASNPLLGAKNCVITPHVAWGSVESRIRLIQTLVDNIRSFRDGAPQNVVNG